MAQSNIKNYMGDFGILHDTNEVRRNKTYQDNENKIHKVICSKISTRQFLIKAQDIYKEAGVTKTTFYLHYPKYLDARDALENKLLLQFEDKLLHNYGNRPFFYLLAEFIERNQLYFCAAQQGSDHYLLTKILLDNQDRLTHKSTSKRAFCLYVRRLQSLIDNWLEFEEVTPATMLKCARVLQSIEPIAYW